MEVIKTSFPHLLEGEAGKKRIEAIIPTYGTDYRSPEHAARFNELGGHPPRVSKHNPASIRVLRKAGFAPAGENVFERPDSTKFEESVLS